MTDHDQLEDRDPALESLLRATFRAEATGRVPDDVPLPTLPTPPAAAPGGRSRRRWVGVSTVAAGLVAAGVAAALIGHEALDAAPRPTPAATASDIPTAGPTGSPTTTPSPTGSPTGSTAVPTTSAPAGVATKQVTFQGVVLTVPATWNVVDRPAGESGETASICLTTGTAIRQTGTATDNCDLNVSVGAALWGSTDVDRVGFAPDGGLCGTDHRTPHQTDTVAANDTVIDGQAAVYRGFSGSCLDHVLDQWTVPTAPFVQFWRDDDSTDPAARAVAVQAVQSAQLPGPRSALWLTDFGDITAVSGNTVSLDRVTSLNQLGTQNSNPATYDYPVAADATIEYVNSTAPDPLTIAQLRALAAGQSVPDTPPLDTLSAQLTTDGSQVTSIDLYDRRS